MGSGYEVGNRLEGVVHLMVGKSNYRQALNGLACMQNFEVTNKDYRPDPTDVSVRRFS